MEHEQQRRRIERPIGQGKRFELALADIDVRHIRQPVAGCLEHVL